ncbi:hypothetical protein [Corallibacter sp.]|uniref:hypothetical protein n=1 Tax=Corallibacter sp. TaxID=2038084 RepID=UPI003AB5366E
MIKKILAILCILVSSQALFAQHGQAPVGQSLQSNSFGETMNALNSRGSWLPPLGKRNIVDGTPFAFEGSDNKVILYTKKGDAYKVPKGNYDAQRGVFVSSFTKDSTFVFNNRDVDYALINNKKMVRLSDAVNSNGKFYLVLAENQSTSIVKEFEAKIIPGAINPLTQEKTSNDRYYLSEDLLIYKDNELDKLKLNKRVISNLFSDKEKEIKAYIKEKDLNIKELSDFLKIYTHYNSLKS